LNNKIDGKRQERIDFFKHVNFDKLFLKFYRTIPHKEKKRLKLLKQRLVINLQNLN